MLSKEEIEKDIELFESVDLGDDIEFIKARKNILQYINKLEQENKKQNESAYWKGYIQKQQESMEICKMCKFRKQYFEKKVEEKNE